MFIGTRIGMSFRFFIHLTAPTVLKNYFLIAIRNLRRQPAFTAINVFGLGVGMAACLLIGLFVWQERTYDRFHENADRLYRVWIVEAFGEDADRRVFTSTSTPVILGPTLEETFADVEAAVRVSSFETGNPVGPPDRRFDEPLHFVDPQFLEVFSFRLVHGDPSTALAAPGRAVITTEVAEHYFPGRDAMGEVLPVRLEGEDRPYIVSGIVEPPPVASSLQFRILLPYEDWAAMVGPGSLTSWHNVSGETFVLAREGTTRAELEDRFPAMIESVVRQDWWEEESVSYTIHLQPVTDLNLGVTLPDEIAPVTYRQYLSLLTLIAAFVLLVAAINFVTLSLGQSTRRSREVGMRRTLGAQRAQIATQFWGEALILAALSLGFGLSLAATAAPWFSQLAGVELVFDAGWRTGGLVLLLMGVVGIGAGAYPALVLSGFRPIEALKDRFQITGDRSLLRRTLVVVQFGLAILLIIGTLFVSRQLDYMRSAPLGFDQEQAVIIPTGMALARMLPVLERFKELSEAQPRVRAVSASAFALNEDWAWGGYTDNEGIWRTLRMNWGEPDFLEVAGVELIAGRMLHTASSADSMRIIVNSALVREYGWETPQEAIGSNLPGNLLAPFEIAGVVSNFHYSPLREEIAPLVYTLNPGALMRALSDFTASASSLRKIIVRIDPVEVPATLAMLRETWERAAPEIPYTYYFLDDAVQARYIQEERLSRIAAAGSALAIAIAGLGLFAMATLAVSRRRKEVGVRRVLGAGTAGLVALLSKDFVKLIMISFAVAAPVAYAAVSRWLETFAYRIDPEPGVFVIAGILAVTVALVTVSIQAFRAAMADPVNSLRDE